MIYQLLYIIGAYLLYKYFLKGIIWIVKMKLKYGSKVNYWYFPVIGINLYIYLCIFI